jgi:hypothetical protein
LVGEPKLSFVLAAIDLAQLSRDPSEHLAAFGFGRLILVLRWHVLQADHFENFFPTNDVLSISDHSVNVVQEELGLFLFLAVALDAVLLKEGLNPGFEVSRIGGGEWFFCVERGKGQRGSGEEEGQERGSPDESTMGSGGLLE